MTEGQELLEALRSIQEDAEAALNAMTYHVDLEQVKAALIEIAATCRRHVAEDEETDEENE